MTQFASTRTQDAPGSQLLGEKDLLEIVLRSGIEDFVWVPCSVTAGLESLASRDPRVRFVATNHEGNLAGIAAGIWFATGRPALVHMQNSGLCNAGDGFISFLGPEVYGIPALALVTWRGHGEEDDSEPHLAIGARTEALTDAVFGASARQFGCRDGVDLRSAVASACGAAVAGEIGVVRISPKGLLAELPLHHGADFVDGPACAVPAAPAALPDLARSRVTRDEALRAIVARHPDAAILFGNGYTARAAQAVVDRPGNFYNVGYMGGTLAVGWGLATRRPYLEVVVVDGDQNALMSTFKDTLEAGRPPNLHWYVLDNGIGASVGTAKSLPLTAQIRQLAQVVETIPDAPGAFSHPRVRAHGAVVDILPADERRGTLNDLAAGFRRFIRSTETNP